MRRGSRTSLAAHWLRVDDWIVEEDVKSSDEAVKGEIPHS